MDIKALEDIPSLSYAGAKAILISRQPLKPGEQNPHMAGKPMSSSFYSRESGLKEKE